MCVCAMVRLDAIALGRAGDGAAIGGKMVEALFLGEKSASAAEVAGGKRLTVTTSDPALAGRRPGDAA